MLSTLAKPQIPESAEPATKACEVEPRSHRDTELARRVLREVSMAPRLRGSTPRICWRLLVKRRPLYDRCSYRTYAPASRPLDSRPPRCAGRACRDGARAAAGRDADVAHVRL